MSRTSILGIFSLKFCLLKSHQNDLLSSAYNVWGLSQTEVLNSSTHTPKNFKGLRTSCSGLSLQQPPFFVPSLFPSTFSFLHSYSFSNILRLVNLFIFRHSLLFYLRLSFPPTHRKTCLSCIQKVCYEAFSLLLTLKYFLSSLVISCITCGIFTTAFCVCKHLEFSDVLPLVSQGLASPHCGQKT